MRVIAVRVEQQQHRRLSTRTHLWTRHSVPPWCMELLLPHPHPTPPHLSHLLDECLATGEVAEQDEAEAVGPTDMALACLGVDLKVLVLGDRPSAIGSAGREP